MYGPYEDAVLADVGLAAIERFMLVDGPDGACAFAAVFRPMVSRPSLAWRDSADGYTSQNRAARTGRFGCLESNSKVH